MSETAVDLPQFTSVLRIANALDVTKPAIFDLIKKGELDAVRVGRKWCVSVESFQDYCCRHAARDADAGLVRAAEAYDQEAEEADAAKDGDEREEEAEEAEAA